MEKKSQTSKAAINELHERIKIQKVNIRPLKQRILSGGDVDNLELGLEKDQQKVEVNAITALFIEEIWSQAVDKIKKRPPGFSAREKLGGFYQLSQSDIAGICFNRKIDSQNTLNFLVNGTSNFLQEETTLWQLSRDRKIEREVGNDLKDKAYARLKKLLFNNRQPSASPGFHIIRGMNTGVSTIWETFGILPEIYAQQFKKPMPKEKFMELARNSLPLIYALASSHLDLFVELNNHYNEGNKFAKNAFHFRKDQDTLKLELKQDIVDKARFARIYDSTYTGCPAIYSKGPSGRNVIAEMFEWLLDMAIKYYLPKLKMEGKIK